MSINEKIKEVERLIKQHTQEAEKEFARCEEDENCLPSRYDEWMKLTQIMNVLQRMFEENHLWFVQDYLDKDFKGIFCKTFEELYGSRHRSYSGYLSDCEGGGQDWYDLCCK